MLTFIELHPFAGVRDKYLTDDEFAALQLHLATHPTTGDVIPRSGGCRKVRWAPEGRGKRGGLRVIYFLRLEHGVIVLVTIYSKNMRDNIDPGLLKRIKEAFEDEEAV
ncbi:MAG: type II toxin-antitoxin system RelE/ParE family toxin [Deltaproteobacteria bacterium]|nr:type II toxin-antitoxin system RelE/ParE family toxin [Deltaproteobacteria bacterium]